LRRRRYHHHSSSGRRNTPRNAGFQRMIGHPAASATIREYHGAAEPEFASDDAPAATRGSETAEACERSM
jgi:hypothetical protein